MSDGSGSTGSRHDLRLGLPAVVGAVAAWGVTGVIIKSIDMDPLSIAAWRFLAYAALLTVWMRARGGRLTISLLRTAMPGGLFLAADVMLFFTAVQLTNIVNATTIGALQPIVIAAFATRVLGEQIAPREYGAAVVAIVGVVVIVTQSSGSPEWSGLGDLAAVGALLAWSGYFIVAKRTAGRLSPLEFTVGAGWWVAALSFPIGLAFGEDMSPPPGSEFAALALLLLVGGFFGHSLMNVGIPRLPLWLSSTLTLLIPVCASLAAWVFLDEALTVWQLSAMAVVLIALAVVVTAQSRPVPVLPPQAPIDPAL
ncbi:MAG: DMT family transporter [Ilumatobacteraceae bacterium]